MAKAEVMVESFPANGGEGTYSYAKNSHYQRLAVNVVKEKIDEVILEKLDPKGLSSCSNTFCIADLGCAAGPNTFMSVQNIQDAVQKKYRLQSPSSTMPEFLVFFNDLASNDFNTLFASLPKEREYFAAGVPGSFHDRLFPEASIHFVHAACALHWLSKVPEELLDKNSPAWNKGRIHYTSAPDEVVGAYAAQFANDTESFLSARAKEIVGGGMMVIIMSGIPYGMPHSQHPAGVMYDCMASTLMDMAKAGLLTEEQVDSFNLPMYAASPEEMSGLVERNGHFSVERMELTNPTLLQGEPVNIRAWTVHMRAVTEELFTRHFGGEVIDEIFERLVTKISECSNRLESSYMEGIQLLAVLKRKDSVCDQP